MCIGVGGGSAGPGLGTAGNPAGSASGNFSGIGSPPGTIGTVPTVGQTVAPPVIGDVMGLGYSDQSAMPANQASALAAESLTGIPFGANNMSFGNDTVNAATPSGSNADLGIFNAITKGAKILGLALPFVGNPALAGAAISASPILGLMGLASAIVGSARGSGQPPGEIGPSMAAGAGPGGFGGPGEAVTFGNLTGIASPILPNEQPAPAAEPRPVAMPVGDITASLFSVPPPKVNVGNLMASRGVRGSGTKTALPEWFNQGKRGY